jgi:YidC/Oxa1 family membrane protein insertase
MDPFFVLPLLMGASMYAQSLLSPAPADPMQAKIMRFMPVAMTVFFLWFPAGLVLYWLANSVLGIAQQWYITRRIDAEYAAKEARSH